MRPEDIAQVTEIDREAFPALWPPANYRREMENRLAHYLVVCDGDKEVEASEEAEVGNGPSGLAAKLRRFFNPEHFFGNEIPPPGKEYVAGFAGMWIMADEAHITNIAVREPYRRRGIGELLLISLTDLVIEIKARFITLEVRASNTDAQSLYRKYGFSQVGVHHGYYTDNREDGLLMSTEDIASAAFQARLQELKRAHSRKWGIALYEIVR